MLGAAGLSLAQLLRSGGGRGDRFAGAGCGGQAGRTTSSSCGCAAGRATSTCGTPSPTRRPSTAASSARSNTNVPGIQLTDMLPMSRADHGQVVDRPQPAPRRRRPLDRRPDLLHRLPPGRNPDENVIPAAARSSREQLGHLSPQLPAYVMIPRMVPGTGCGLPGRGAQAVRDAGRPGQRRPVQAAELSAGRRADARAARRSRASLLSGLDKLRRERRRQRPDGGARPLRPAGLGHPHLARRAEGVRPRQRAAGRSASATASCRRSIPARPTAAVRPPGASGCCSPGGWSRRACGW